ncbi:MAG: acyl-CoA thioesterase [Crocinitomicaceae bacterium]|nr:acyl-CoA thioesterase [Crocinitomicaceae bacterium]
MEFSYKNQTKLRVRYAETDQMGYVYYGNYAQYFEVGRVEAMRNLGMSYRELEENGIMLPVADFSTNYYAPARYDDELMVTTSIVSVKGARLKFDYEIHNDKNELIVKASTTLVFVAKNSMRPIKTPATFLELLKKYSL